MTPLMVAASAGNGLEQCPASSSAYDVSGGSSDVDCLSSSQPPSTGMFITQLLRDGATVNDTTERTGETSLHLAARYARADAAKRLLEAGEARWSLALTSARRCSVNLHIVMCVYVYVERRRFDYYESAITAEHTLMTSLHGSRVFSTCQVPTRTRRT